MRINYFIFGVAALITLVFGACRKGTVPINTKEPSTIKLPDTRAGKKMNAYLEVINSGKTEAILQFVTDNFAPSILENFSAKDRAAAFTRVYLNHHRLDPVRIEKSSQDEIEILAYAPVTEEWMTISLKLEPNAHYSIIDEMIRHVPAPEGFLEHEKITETAVVAALKAYLEKLVKADLFSGAVLVAKDGKPIFSHAYGIANGACGMKNKLDTKFNLGSMNKMFTSVAIAQLVEQGKFAYTDTIEKLLPDYPNKQVAKKVTVEQLLMHTSGLGNFFTKEYTDASKLRFLKTTDYYPLFVNKPLEFEPGTKFGYSNAGFIVLGAIIEKITGQTYFDYVREHIYKPAGMINTDAYDLRRDIPNLAIGYARDNENEPRQNNLFLHVIKGCSAGGGFSTVEDLFHFALALESNKLVNAQYTKLITTYKPKTAENRYAYGFEDKVINGKRVYGHGGGFAGINSQLDIYYPELGYIVAVMANYDPPAALRVANKVRQLITR